MMSFLTLFDSKTDTSLVFTLYGCFAHAGVLSWDRQAQWCILIVCLSNKPHPSFIVTASDLSPASINNLLEQYTSEAQYYYVDLDMVKLWVCLNQLSSSVGSK